jgi:hypothetical protein
MALSVFVDVARATIEPCTPISRCDRWDCDPAVARDNRILHAAAPARGAVRRNCAGAALSAADLQRRGDKNGGSAARPACLIYRYGRATIFL